MGKTRDGGSTRSKNDYFSRIVLVQKNYYIIKKQRLTMCKFVSSKAFNILLVVAVSFLNSQYITADTRHHRRDDVTGHIPSTHEEIISRRRDHHDLFSFRLEDVTSKLDLHSSGERLLTELEYNRLTRKRNAYETKLEELGRGFDERHSKRIMFREELLNDMTKARIGRSHEEL